MPIEIQPHLLVYRSNEWREANNIANATSFKTQFTGLYFSDLLEVLGPPTFPNPSDDGKTQREWVIKYKGKTFTIYDWKNPNEEHTILYNKIWHVGSKNITSKEVMEFVEYIEYLAELHVNIDQLGILREGGEYLD